MDKSFYQKLDTINRMDNKKGEDSLAVQKETAGAKAKRAFLNAAKRRQSNCGTVASLLKAVVFIRAIRT